MTITNYKAINKNTLIGAFDVILPSGLQIFGAMLHRKGDSEWIMFPGRPYQNGGATVYAKLIDIPDREKKNHFDDQVIQALRSGDFIE